MPEDRRAEEGREKGNGSQFVFSDCWSRCHESQKVTCIFKKLHRNSKKLIKLQLNLYPQWNGRKPSCTLQLEEDVFSYASSCFWGGCIICLWFAAPPCKPLIPQLSLYPPPANCDQWAVGWWWRLAADKQTDRKGHGCSTLHSLPPHTHSLGLSTSHVMRVAHTADEIKSLFPQKVSFSGINGLIIVLKLACAIFKLNHLVPVYLHNPHFFRLLKAAVIDTVLTMEHMTVKFEKRWS